MGNPTTLYLQHRHLGLGLNGCPPSTIGLSVALINRERMTAVSDEGFVLFLIGMRINNWFAIHRWLPVFLAMPKMLTELHINRKLGFRSYEMWFARTIILVQYWENPEKLMEYAKARDSEHLPAWRAFNRAATTSGAVGIWHETYVIAAGSTENVYVNMPKFGFGKVGDLQPATGKRNTASGRLGKPARGPRQ